MVGLYLPTGVLSALLGKHHHLVHTLPHRLCLHLQPVHASSQDDFRLTKVSLPSASAGMPLLAAQGTSFLLLSRQKGLSVEIAKPSRHECHQLLLAAPHVCSKLLLLLCPDPSIWKAYEPVDLSTCHFNVLILLGQEPTAMSTCPNLVHSNLNGDNAFRRIISEVATASALSSRHSMHMLKILAWPYPFVCTRSPIEAAAPLTSTDGPVIQALQPQDIVMPTWRKGGVHTGGPANSECGTGYDRAPGNDRAPKSTPAQKRSLN